MPTPILDPASGACQRIRVWAKPRLVAVEIVGTAAQVAPLGGITVASAVQEAPLLVERETAMFDFVVPP